MPRTHNPYNFIPTPPRGRADTDLGDGPPVRHDKLLTGRLSGRLTVRLTTKTPLLATEPPAGPDDAEHAVRVVDGHAELAGSAVRGPLRSAFEAVTNSRMTVIDKHDKRLAFRRDRTTGATVVPARVTDDGMGVDLLAGGYVRNGRLVLRTAADITADGPVPKPDPWGRGGHIRTLYAAFVEFYDRGRPPPPVPGSVRSKAEAHLAPDDHRKEVFAFLSGPQYKYGRGPDPQYCYLRAERIALDETTLGTASPDGCLPKSVKGYLCVTNQNATNKHAEKLFFGHPIPAKTDIGELRKAWSELLSSYLEARTAKEKSNLDSRALFTRENGTSRPAWSRHILDSNEKLSAGDLCYAEVKPGDPPEAIALYPVAIARKLFSTAPIQLLGESLRPPSRLEECSPADRVFGWVGPPAARSSDDPVVAAWRGHVRVSPVRTTASDGDAVKRFTPARTLPALASPKPQQARFYLAKDADGEQPVGGPKADGYEATHSWRGRKVYPYQRNFNEPPEAEPGELNRSVKGWIKRGQELTATISVTNLSEFEAGALLFLLTLGEKATRCLSFGGGRPLGFGAAAPRLDYGGSWLSTPDGLKDSRYASWSGAPPALTEPAAAALVETFHKALERAYGSEAPTFLQSFLRAAEGYDDGLRTAYPRLANGGEGYEWFVANENGRRPARPKRHSLPHILEDAGLPDDPT